MKRGLEEVEVEEGPSKKVKLGKKKISYETKDYAAAKRKHGADVYLELTYLRNYVKLINKKLGDLIEMKQVK